MKNKIINEIIKFYDGNKANLLGDYISNKILKIDWDEQEDYVKYLLEEKDFNLIVCFDNHEDVLNLIKESGIDFIQFAQEYEKYWDDVDADLKRGII